MEDLSQQAISFALQGKWHEALKINLLILQNFGKNSDALNRTARCYSEIGEFKKAKNFVKEVLSFEPNNPIALKSLARLEALKKGAIKTTGIFLANVFLEEPGKTKIVSLVKLANPDLLLALSCGEEVLLEIHKHHIDVTNAQKKYIGKLPDDIADRIIKLAESGNEYKTYVKCSTGKEMKVFIKETKKAKGILHITSFPTERFQYIAFTSPQLVHKKNSPRVSTNIY